MLEQLKRMEQELNKIKRRLALYHLLGKHDQKTHASKKGAISQQSSSSPLSTMKIKSSSSLGGGFNGSYIVELDDGAKAVFKPVQEEAAILVGDVGAGTLADREVLAYDLDRDFFGYGIVPETVSRKIEYVNKDGNTVTDRGSLQKWSNGQSFVSPVTSSNNRGELFLFDVVTGNRDRHGGNILLNNDKYVAIDNGVMMRNKVFSGRSYTERSERWLGSTVGKQIDYRLIDNLDKIDRSKYRAAIKKSLGSTVADLAVNRLNEVVRIGRESATWTEFIGKYSSVRLSE